MIKYYIDYYDNKQICSEYWYLNDGIYHREDGPALIHYYNNETLFPNDNQFDICHSQNNHVYYESWFINGHHHRENGPAFICYNYDGQVSFKEYWINDHKITDFVEKLFGDIPDKLSKEQQVLLKLSLSRHYLRIPNSCYMCVI